ncbi:ArdC family protein [Novosphingobium sp. KACC 22771]|uniref:ArdC family protein n=1 Tax=Novosphingobium sp. KACC 22771 TaxID=3025670 RepID=UPI002366ECB4|nr:ArdC-like ssDNA-binding domain-containing protein [Novosphingobium sp. KACC 22771]WDF71339.1 zincin-like metallopeptidase domain-containing protein [Novosphingobium sp. KACC 22771]
MRQTGRSRALGESDAPRGGNRHALYDEVTGKIIAQLEAGRFPWVQPWGAASGSGLGPALPRNALSGGNRHALYDEVTGKIIAQLEAGRFPWVQPWGAASGSGLGPALPRNALTGRAYSGVNVLLLWGSVIEEGYPSQGWLTFRQALEAGGNVRKGEKGVTVVYADRFTPQAEKARAQESGEDARSVPFLKRFTVFNLAQCEGMREGLSADPEPLPERQIVPLAEEVIDASGVPFRIGGAKAFYVPSTDYVQVPPQPAFFEQINYYRTALHELTHATGHGSRLDRKIVNPFASKDYAREELVAEMGSAFLCAALGIVPTVRHADYLGSWLEVLREDNRAIFRAAGQASKAADWLLTRHAEHKAGKNTDDNATGDSEMGEGRAAA